MLACRPPPAPIPQNSFSVERTARWQSPAFMRLLAFAHASRFSSCLFHRFCHAQSPALRPVLPCQRSSCPAALACRNPATTPASCLNIPSAPRGRARLLHDHAHVLAPAWSSQGHFLLRICHSTQWLCRLRSLDFAPFAPPFLGSALA